MTNTYASGGARFPLERILLEYLACLGFSLPVPRDGIAYHGLVEQNEVHHGVALIIFLKLGIQNSFQRRCIRNRGVRVGSARSAESREYHRWREHVALVDGKG